MITNKQFEWAVVGAGPAGIASIGELLDSGVRAESIVWIDPDFCVGDFGLHWKYVTSNTSVDLFLQFLNGYQSFKYSQRNREFHIDKLDKHGFCELIHVAEPLQWITKNLRECVVSYQNEVEEIFVGNECWALQTTYEKFAAEKVILAIGSEVKTLPKHEHIEEISLNTALNPQALENDCHKDDVVAVFGSSHSSMIIIRELARIGVKEIINFYLNPIKYAVRMDGWTLYDNTGLKAETAKWTRENISKKCLSNIKRYFSSQENIESHIKRCNKAVYAVGFKVRDINVRDIVLSEYDQNTGIIAPGLFGVGIGFPQIAITPLGHRELNVGLWKFMNDIRKVMPIWKQYAL